MTAREFNYFKFGYNSTALVDSRWLFGARKMLKANHVIHDSIDGGRASAKVLIFLLEISISQNRTRAGKAI